MTRPCEADTPAQRLFQLVKGAPDTEAELVAALELSATMSLDDALEASDLSVSDLVIAAEIVGVPVTVLTGHEPLTRNLGVALRLDHLPAAAPREAVEYAERVMRYQALLDSWLGKPAPRFEKVSLSKDRYMLAAGELSAQRLRDLLGDERGPIGDLVALVEALGYPVVFMPLPEKISGLTVKQESLGETRLVILISTGKRWARQRYTLAHELCHALYADGGQVIVDYVEEAGDEVAQHPAPYPEIRAETFARHLLFPRAAAAAEMKLWRRSSEPLDRAVARLMITYGISRDSLLKTLVADQLLTEDEARPILHVKVEDLMFATPWKDTWDLLCKQQDEVSGSPTLVARALDAYDQGYIDVSVVADLLQRDLDTVMRQLEESGRSPQASS